MLANNEKKFPAVLSMLNQAIKQDKIPVAKTEIASLINAYQ
jgi:hypothetical protein